MSDILEFDLAGVRYRVRRLTLRQLRDLQIGAAKAFRPPEDLAARIAESYDGDLSILATALSRDNPEITVDALYGMEITKEEIGAVALDILKFSGLVKPGETEAATE